MTNATHTFGPLAPAPTHELVGYWSPVTLVARGTTYRRGLPYDYVFVADGDELIGPIPAGAITGETVEQLEALGAEIEAAYDRGEYDWPEPTPFQLTAGHLTSEDRVLTVCGEPVLAPRTPGAGGLGATCNLCRKLVGYAPYDPNAEPMEEPF